MSLFKTRRDRRTPVVPERQPARFDTSDPDAATASAEGVTLDSFVTFIAMVGQPQTPTSKHEHIAQQLGFPAGRYDLIRNLWMMRVYSSPTLAREFGERLDEARKNLA
jgi:hypothetical protein